MTHDKILESLAKRQYDNGKKFTVSEKLTAIRDVLRDSPFKEIYKGKLCSIWAKTDKDDLPEQLCLMSSHIDNVSAITKPFSKLEDGIYKGTYDNLGTNAALCALMKDHEMPDNMVFAFTGDEETGQFRGLKEANEFLKGRIVLGIACDVTYEGFYDNKLMSVENISGGRSFATRAFEVLKNTEPDGIMTFSVTPKNKKNIPENLGSYFSNSFGMCDEAFFFPNAGYPGMSICVPTSGEMHGNSGLKMKEAVFDGYVLSLATSIYALTNTYPEKIEEAKQEKASLYQKAVETKISKSYGSSYGYDFSELTSSYRGDNPYYSYNRYESREDFDESVADNYSYNGYDNDMSYEEFYEIQLLEQFDEIMEFFEHFDPAEDDIPEDYSYFIDDLLAYLDDNDFDEEFYNIAYKIDEYNHREEKNYPSYNAEDELIKRSLMDTDGYEYYENLVDPGDFEVD